MSESVAVVCSAVAMLSAAFSTGCGGSALGDGSVHVLSTAEAKRALLKLPYSYTFRQVPLPEGASGALAGRALGKHHTVLNFGVALGKEPKGVPVPRSGTEESYGYPYGGFIYTDDLQVPGKRRKWIPGPQFHTAAQWEEGGRMEVQMEEKLCRAATGEPCHEG